MYKTLISPLFKLFNENTYPELDADEKNAFNSKYPSILREGVRFVPGGRFGKGRIIMTKTVDENFNDFFEKLIESLRFPGILSVDAHGFVETREGEPIFLFGSINSSIKLWNEE